MTSRSGLDGLSSGRNRSMFKRGFQRLQTRQYGLLKLVMPGLLLVFLCLVPFLNKAYTIDDPWFLLEAKHILQDPLQPMAFEICWMPNENCLKNAGSLGAGSAQALMGTCSSPSS